MFLRRGLRFITDRIAFLRVRHYSDVLRAGRRLRSKRVKLGKLETMKLENDQFRRILSPEMKVVEELFKKNGYQLRIAGGAVRDLLMGITPHDIDFASTATPTQMKELFESEGIRMINASGERHGTITARVNDKENFEITTLRVDTVTDGRHAEVEFTTDWQMDANRRDLTVNAMFLSFDGTVFDYFKGIEHLAQRKVLFVGDAARRIQEDYLRILRYFRFYGRLAVDENAHDASTLEAIRLNTDGLASVSGERLYTELQKIVDGRFHHSMIRLMAELGVLQYLGFPRNPNLDEFSRVCKRCQDLEALAPTKLAALLRTEDEIMQLHARLKLSNFEKHLLLYINRYRNALSNLSDEEKLRTSQAYLYRNDFKLGAPKDRLRWIKELLKYEGEGDVLQKMEAWDPPKCPVSGFDLQLFGFRKGPQLGEVVGSLREIWLESDFTLGKEELLQRARVIREELRSRRSREPSPKGSPSPDGDCNIISERDKKT
ncbi:CCA tRNA nucleotidyltransferase 1, mitochondrial [Galendromus occidentalis]|uniref:CCA tRNA nucleotidyltransferase 1, mitochondrial n=1 Tax=Galendromus occidentalis TaxID=34638 RepID=A0AAJ6QMS4_9ACAR|nr:CCA tRNA nucleotidyltransferase 1, mitochondrial [Galendromus occidentalis]